MSGGYEIGANPFQWVPPMPTSGPAPYPDVSSVSFPTAQRVYDGEALPGERSVATQLGATLVTQGDVTPEEPITVSLRSKPWERLECDREWIPGQPMFSYTARMRPAMDGLEVEGAGYEREHVIMSAPQLNLVLRNLYATEQRCAPTGVPPGVGVGGTPFGTGIAPAPVLSEEAQLAAMDDQGRAKFWHLSAREIGDTVKYVGVLRSTAPAGSGRVQIEVAVGGGRLPHPGMPDYWGVPAEHHPEEHVGFVVKRDQRGVSGPGPFQLFPWHSIAAARPPRSELRYLGAGNAVEEGYFYYVGKAVDCLRGPPSGCPDTPEGVDSARALLERQCMLCSVGDMYGPCNMDGSKAAEATRKAMHMIEVIPGSVPWMLGYYA